MSSAQIAWNAFYDKYNREPTTADELQNFTQNQKHLEEIDTNAATDTFNAQKGKGLIKHVHVPSDVSIVYNDDEIARAVSSELGQDKKEGDGTEIVYDVELTNNLSMEEPIPSAPPQRMTVPTSSEIEDDLPESKAKGSNLAEIGEENVNDKQSKDSHLESLQTESATADKFKMDGIIKMCMKSPEYLVLILSIFALLFPILVLLPMKGTINGKLDSYEQGYNAALESKLHYDTVDESDANQVIYVNNYYGWTWKWVRDASYRRNSADYQGGNDVQYPLPDIRVKYGDKLVFSRVSSDQKLADNLLLVPKEVYDSCDFTDYVNADGEVDDTSDIWLADASDLWNENGTAEYVFPIEDWSEYEFDNDLFAQLLTADILYFTSSFKWDGKTEKLRSCQGGLKLRVIIDRSYRTTMPVKRSSDKWRGIESTESVEELSASIGHVTRMLMLKQFTDEQRIRSDGDSGISNVRGLYDGSNSWDDGTYFKDGTAAVHDHADHLRVIGIGEFQAVLNGVEFQTRHNDYNLEMPSTTSSEYGATEDIVFPDVPDEVKNAGSVEDQIAEMQEWFRAFKAQETSERDYTKYFKPILCYLEGTWLEETEEIEEPFNSDVTEFVTTTWYQLNDKMRYLINSGRKSIDEALAHLPSSIRNTVNDTYPTVSNWEYRIICHPLNDDLPTERLRVSNDLNVQLYGAPLSRDDLNFSRRARFDLNKYINMDDINGDNIWSPGRKKWNYLDYIMEQIPGKDNYPANMSDELPDGTGRTLHYLTDQWVNTGYYSRFYKLSGADAMGATGHRRSWCDRVLFAAKTTSTKVSPISMTFEVEDEETEELSYWPTSSRWSYAIPLEIIYLTPLTKWNPYNIKEKDSDDFDYDRSGGCSSSDAFNGWTYDNAYFTPAAFYDDLTQSSPADTAIDNACAIGGDGDVYPVVASGHYIIFPEIGGGVGKVRQRYPIYPIHYGGSNEHKEIKALQEIILDDDYDDEINGLDTFSNGTDLVYGFEMSLQGGDHQHMIYIPGWKVKEYWQDYSTHEWLTTSDDVIEIEVEESDEHQHVIRIWRDKDSNDEWVYNLKECRYGTEYDESDGWTDECVDGHDTLNRY